MLTKCSIKLLTDLQSTKRKEKNQSISEVSINSDHVKSRIGNVTTSLMKPKSSVCRAGKSGTGLDGESTKVLQRKWRFGLRKWQEEVDLAQLELLVEGQLGHVGVDEHRFGAAEEAALLLGQNLGCFHRVFVLL